MATKAKDTADYIRGLKIGQGDHLGEPFNLLAWERRFLRGGLATGIDEAALTIARGNGKTAFCAAIASAAIDNDGPLAVQGSEVALVSETFDVACIAFRHIKRFLGPTLTKHKSDWRLWDSKNAARLENKKSDIILQVRGADRPGTLHGMAPRLLLCDEVAVWKHTTIDASLSALRTGLGKIPGGLLLALGTRADSETHPFSILLNETADYAQTHAPGEDEPLFQKRTWKKANPSLDHLPTLERKIRKHAEQARRDPAAMQSFKALRLNMGTSDIEVLHLLDADEWQSIEKDVPREGPCFWGVDLGGALASSSIASYWPLSGRLEAIGMFGSIPDLKKRGLRDGVGRLYVDCHQRGELFTSGGRVPEYGALLAKAQGRFGNPAGLSCDTYRENELRDALDGSGIPLCPIVPRRNGFIEQGQDVRAFKRACFEGRCFPAPSLYLAACVGAARLVVDPAGNNKLAKNTEGKRMRARDDGAAAGILAVALGERKRPKTRGAYLGAV